MAFCVSCGADVTGKNFCMKCGKPVAAAQPAAAAAPQPASYAAPKPGAYAASPAVAGPPKKVSPIVWIIGGIFGFFILLGLIFTVGVGMFVHSVKRNPALAAAKLLTLGNPDVEVLSSDEGNNTVTFRDKKTHETVTMNFDDIKKGKIVFKGNNGQEATIQAQASGNNGTVEITSPQGSMKFGAGGDAKLPDWVPAYPGASPQSTFSMQGNDGAGGQFTFTTGDSPKSVLSFYEQGLQRNGFKITANVSGNAAGSSGGMLSAEDEASKRTFLATVGTDKGATSVSVIFGTKK